MNNRNDRIRTTSGLMFKGEKYCLVRYSIQWKITLNQEIDRRRMQEALDAALQVCPYMGMGMTMEEDGMWYVPNLTPAVLFDEMPERLGGEETGGHLFCLVCGRRDLHLAVHHGLTDGTGTRWFLDALLTAYYGDHPAASGASGNKDAADRAVDLVELSRGLAEDSVPGTGMPERYFKFPGADEGDRTQSTLAVFSGAELQTFCREHGCSVTDAMVTFLSMAIQRTYPENSAPVCVRCPIDSRKILGAPDTFLNASLPQALTGVEASRAAEGRVDEILREVDRQIGSQKDRECVARFSRLIGEWLRHEPSRDVKGVMDLFSAPIVFSRIRLEPSQQAAGHIIGAEFHAYAGVPLMVTLITAGNLCYLTFDQSFEETAYQDALQEVMEACGIGLSLFGRLARAPRFMDRMAGIVRRYGSRPALVDEKRTLTYADLDRESGKIYHYLKRHGVGRESMVQVVMPRCAAFYSCLGGVLRAGAAFVPLEDTYPAQRIAFIREDAACSCVLDETLYEQIMEQEEYLPGYEKTEVHDACYAVYTSGSTGNPKGVLHEYGSLDAGAAEVPERDEYPELQEGEMEPFYFAAMVVYGIPRFLSAVTVHIIRRDVVRNLSLLASFIEDHRIEKIFMTPSYVRMYRHPAPSLKEVVVAGEPASEVYFPGGVPVIHNTYGMSEAGFLIAGTILEHAYATAPVGIPLMPYSDLHLEDEEGRRIIGPGKGELCYRSLFLREYINQPEKTAHAIRDGVFHSNDLVSRDESGLYYIIGRLDDMFKINGNRVEPAEIERRVREATGLEEVVARGFTGTGRAFICVYFLKEEAQRLKIWDGEKLTCSLESLHEHLPDYMIPSHYMALDEFPHNANGKLVRKQLPEPEMGTVRQTYTAPEGEKEKLLCSLMEKALHLDRVGAEDDFYEIGGDSMGAIVLLGLCADAGVEIPLSMLYQNRTARNLAKAWEAGQISSGNLGELSRAAMSRPQPILYEQLEHLRQLEKQPDALTYNIPQLFKLKEGVNLASLRTALDRVFRAHPVLLSFFRKTDGAWYQVFDAHLFEPTQIITMSDEAFEREKDHLVRPFDGPGKALHRRALYHTDSADYLFWDFHHSIADGTSLTLMREQVWLCYEDADYPIPEDYYPYFLEQLGKTQRDETAPVNREAKEFYDKRFDTAPGTLALTPDLTGPDGKNAILTGHREQRRTQDGGSALFLAATVMAAAGLNAGKKALVYSAYHGRDQEAKRQAVGMFATYVPVYLDMGRAWTAEEILNEVREQLNFGLAHCVYPFRQQHPASSCNTVVFNYQKDTFDLGPLSAIIAERVPMKMGQDNQVVTGLIDIRGNESLTWYCGYNTGWYSKERIEAFHASFREAAARLLETEEKTDAPEKEKGEEC